MIVATVSRPEHPVESVESFEIPYDDRIAILPASPAKKRQSRRSPSRYKWILAITAGLVVISASLYQSRRLSTSIAGAPLEPAPYQWIGFHRVSLVTAALAADLPANSID